MFLIYNRLILFYPLDNLSRKILISLLYIKIIRFTLKIQRLNTFLRQDSRKGVLSAAT